MCNCGISCGEVNVDEAVDEVIKDAEEETEAIGEEKEEAGE